MKVHAIALAKETGIPPAHVLAAGLQIGFSSLEEALEGRQLLRLSNDTVQEIVAELERQEVAAQAAAEDFFKQTLQSFQTLAEMEAYIRSADDGLRVQLHLDENLRHMYLGRRLEFCTTLDQASQIWSDARSHPEIASKAHTLWEQFALDAARKARSFAQAWSAYQLAPDFECEASKVAFEKVKRWAKTKPQLKMLCEHFAPYDPAQEERPDPDATAEPASETYLFFVRKLAVLYPLSEVT